MSDQAIDDRTAANAFRRLLAHLQHHDDVQNIDMKTATGFCRNRLAEWVAEASDGALDCERAEIIVYGMPRAQWEESHRVPPTHEQVERLEEVKAKKHEDARLDAALDDSFPASDPPAMSIPRH